MAGIRERVLRKVFKEGVESVPKETLERLFKTTKNKLYRHDWKKKELLTGGFDPSRQSYYDPNDIPGLYYAKSPKELQEFVTGFYPDAAASHAPNVIGIKRPGSRTAKVVEDSMIDEPYFAKNFDFLERGSNPPEVIQLKRGNVLARIGKDKYRILGVTGALGIGGSQMAPDEAQAFPIGKAFKVGQKALGSLSSASERLAGKTVQGKIVKEVRKGHGNWRQIIFEDGDVRVLTKDYVHSLARAKGTDKYLNAFATKNKEGQLQQALKSMSIHESMIYPPRTTLVHRGGIANLHEAYRTRAQRLQVEIPDSVMVQRGKKSYMMPRPYAEILQRNGILQIIQSPKPATFKLR